MKRIKVQIFKTIVKVKKMPETVDKPLILNTKRYQLILQIQEYVNEGCSLREISRRLGISRNTASKFKTGNPEVLCQYGIKQSKLDNYQEQIVSCMQNGMSKSATLRHIYELGYNGGSSNAFDYFKKIEQATEYEFEPQLYERTKTTALKNNAGSEGQEYSYITRNGVFRYLWMNGELSDHNRDYIFKKYPLLFSIKQCIVEFRNIFDTKNVPCLYLFIEKYSDSEIKSVKSFATGLTKDIDAVENAVAYDLSNGFVEGTNNKLKMIKRTMYGRCKPALLSAKMMLLPAKPDM